MSDVDDAGGAGAAPVREKTMGSTAVSCPMLTATNYTVWAMRMKVVLRIHKVWGVIDPGTETSEEKDCLAMGLLYQAIPETLIIQIGDQATCRRLWEAIKARHVGADRVKEARLQTLMYEFDKLKMKETETIDTFAGKLSEITSKSAALGEAINESKLVKKFLTSLPRSKFIQIVASLEQVLDLKTVGFEDVVGRLKAYEERVKAEDDGGGEQQRVLMARSGGGGCGGSSGGGSGFGDGGSTNRGRRKGKWKESIDSGSVNRGSGSSTGSATGPNQNGTHSHEVPFHS